VTRPGLRPAVARLAYDDKSITLECYSITMNVDTRARILDAALVCFIEAGYEQTTIARIRQRSGVSNGALFHHFATKGAIADALHVEAIASFQDGLWELLRGSPSLGSSRSPAARSHTSFTGSRPTQIALGFYTCGGTSIGDSPAGARLQELNRNLADAYRDWMTPFIETGQLRPMSMLMLTAIVTGPGPRDRASLARRNSSAHRSSAYLGRGWQTPPARRSAGRPPAPDASRARSRVTAGSGWSSSATDGSVIADGQATAELRPPRAGVGRMSRGGFRRPRGATSPSCA